MAPSLRSWGASEARYHPEKGVLRTQHLPATQQAKAALPTFLPITPPSPPPRVSAWCLWDFSPPRQAPSDGQNLQNKRDRHATLGSHGPPELSEKGRRLQGTAQPWDHCGGSRVPGDGDHQPCPGHPLGTVHSRGWAAPGRAVTQSHNTTAHPKNGGGCVSTAETQAAARGQE